MWKFPRKYKQSFIIAFSLLITGFLLEIITDSKVMIIPGFPGNLAILMILVSTIVFLAAGYPSVPFIKWMGSVPAAVSAIVVFTFLILLMGFIPQQPSENTFVSRLGLNHILTGWHYFFMSFYLVFILGFTVVKRIYPFNLRNGVFFLNHAGLWIVLTAASLGSSDTIQLQMAVQEGETVWFGFDRHNRKTELPFAIHLHDFSMEEYHPELAVVNHQNRIIHSLGMIHSGDSMYFRNWQVSVEDFSMTAVPYKDAYYFVNENGAMPAALVRIKNSVTGECGMGWITCGSHIFNPQHLPLEDTLFLAMTTPPPKKFASQVKVYRPDKAVLKTTIEVNKPCKVNGWKIYQSSYDTEKGRWSRHSVFELVKDPWLSVVYAGVFMLLAGSAMLFWLGKKRTKNHEAP